MDTVMGGLREAAATREAALQEARRSLGDREAALRDKEARLGPAAAGVGQAGALAGRRHGQPLRLTRCLRAVLSAVLPHAVCTPKLSVPD